MPGSQGRVAAPLAASAAFLEEGQIMRDYEECRPYIQHLLAEHRRLHKLIQQARKSITAIDGVDRDPNLANIPGQLRDLRTELVQHFQEEEGGGCLDEAVSRCPRLAADAKRLEAQHPTLLAGLDRLIAQAANGPCDTQAQLALHRDFTDLCRQLHAHEAAENELLKEGFGANVNGDENGFDAAYAHENYLI